MRNLTDLPVSCTWLVIAILVVGHSYLYMPIAADVNECTTGAHTCGDASRCKNTNGSYYCLCAGESDTAPSFGGKCDSSGSPYKADKQACAVNSDDSLFSVKLKIPPGMETVGWDGSCYSIVYSAKIRWNDARKACQELSGDLATVGSQAEQDWLFSQLNRLGSMLSCEDKWGYWLALSANDSIPAKWQWIDGEPLNDTITQWSPGEPNNKGTEDCVEINNRGTLNNLHCHTAVPYICERNSSVPVVVANCTGAIRCDRQAQCLNVSGSYRCVCKAGYSGNGTSCTDVNECITNQHECLNASKCKNTEGSFYCKCPQVQLVAGPSSIPSERIGWRSSCYSVVDSSKKTWKDAQEYCQNRFGDLVIIGSKAEQDWLNAHLQRISLISLSSSACGGGWWYGLNQSNSAWKWVDNTPLDTDVVNWAPGEPSRPKRNRNRNINNEQCVEFSYNGLLNNLKCESDLRNFICERDTAPNPCKYNNTCHPDLATCNNTLEGRGYTCTCKAGYSGDGSDCRDTNECMTGAHTCGDPNRCKNTVGSYYCLCPKQSDTPASQDIGTFGWGGSCYYVMFSTKRTWEAARLACQEQSGDLVTIGSKAEQEWLHIHLARISQMLSCGVHWSYWCGLNSTDGATEWTWIDGTTLKDSNMNWSEGEPNNGYREKCAEIVELGTLNNLGCRAQRYYVCERNSTITMDACMNKCHTDAHCSNKTGGGYRCKCNSGYSGDGMNCPDVDECKSGIHNCGDSLRCRNTGGSFYCLCPGETDKTEFSVGTEASRPSSDGEIRVAWGDSCYTIMGATKQTWSAAQNSCLEQNASLVSIGSKEEQIWLHANLPEDAFSSACHGGWWYGLNRTSNNWLWVDGTSFNNSAISWHEGEPNNLFRERCAEVVFGGTLNNLRCDKKLRYVCEQDIFVDECKWDIPPCGDLQAFQCTNIPGSYKCTCNSGYTGDEKTCKDINECESGVKIKCHPDAICQNSRGSYTCHCKTGYSGDGMNCSDIDECNAQHVKSPCHHNSTCLNALGSYMCKCPDGFYGGTCSESVHAIKYVISKDIAGTYAAITLGVVLAILILAFIIFILVRNHMLSRYRRKRWSCPAHSLVHLNYGKLGDGEESPIPGERKFGYERQNNSCF